MKAKHRKRINTSVDRFAEKSTAFLGSPTSLVLHTVFFIGVFFLVLADIPLDDVLLILTTVVSLEAIYLALFIQISVNRQSLQLQAVGDEVEEISRDIDEIQEEVEDLAEEVEEIGEDIEEDDREDEITHQADVERIEKIEGMLSELLTELRSQKKK